MWPRLFFLYSLSAYLILGLPLAPFHADEAIHLAAAQDYVVYFVLHRPGDLRADPPPAIDSPAYIRLVGGSLNAYLSGAFLWHSGAVSLGAWPPAWYFPDSPAENQARGRWPAEAVLWWGRLASALCGVVSLWGLFALMQQLADPPSAYAATLFYALHPLILLNLRRGMQEGALLCFCVLALWLAWRVYRRPSWAAYALWGMASGLALASKATALLALAAMWLAWLSLRPGGYGRGLLLYALALGGVYLALTPAIWGDPPGRAWLAAQLRAEILAGQRDQSGLAYASPLAQAAGLWQNAFPAGLQFYESPDFAGEPRLAAQIAPYEASPWAGWAWPPLVMAFLIGRGGLALSFSPKGRFLALWVALVGLGLGLAVPLAWQRYYLLWTLALCCLAGVGAAAFIQDSRKWCRKFDYA
jgi:4-amino-4-deoxy-L-arabinose transferase-like glycosyltransferase